MCLLLLCDDFQYRETHARTLTHAQHTYTGYLCCLYVRCVVCIHMNEILVFLFRNLNKQIKKIKKNTYASTGIIAGNFRRSLESYRGHDQVYEYTRSFFHLKSVRMRRIFI